MNATEKEITLVEHDRAPAQYDMERTEAIIDRPDRGRLYICQGFGGMDSVQGGGYRWLHGMACKIKDTDTLESLRSEMWNDHALVIDAMSNGYDDERPILDMSGWQIKGIAESVGL